MGASQGNAQRILTPQELKRILEAPDPESAGGRRDRAVLELLGGAGLKVQQLLPLRLADLDLQVSCILLPDDGCGGVRAVPFKAGTRAALLSYILDIRDRIQGPEALLFPARDQGPLTRQAVWKIVRKYAAAAGIGHPVSPEDLRASLAVSLLMQGADPSGVRQMLGIGAPAMRRYRRILQET